MSQWAQKNLGVPRAIGHQLAGRKPASQCPRMPNGGITRGNGGFKRAQIQRISGRGQSPWWVHGVPCATGVRRRYAQVAPASGAERGRGWQGPMPSRSKLRANCDGFGAACCAEAGRLSVAGPSRARARQRKPCSFVILVEDAEGDAGRLLAHQIQATVSCVHGAKGTARDGRVVDVQERVFHMKPGLVEADGMAFAEFSPTALGLCMAVQRLGISHRDTERLLGLLGRREVVRARGCNRAAHRFRVY
mmetsp:Transcript_63381/g.183596  ORF Transcript_63381/g.183596 Transcript_63381/m.183596 type:complete len:248 (+) Transcript_63381:217-960(+)